MAKILVFDSDPKFGGFLKEVLAKQGHEPILAPDGYSVLGLAEKLRPELVILDYKLPEVAGFEILQRLRKSEACASVPVLFASTTSKYEIELNVMNDSAVGYVEKPIDPAKLAQAISEMLKL